MKNIKKLFILFVLPLLCVSCLVDDNNETGFEYSPYIVGFNKSVAAENYFADEGVVLAGYKINVLGGNSGIVPAQDITISYVIDTANSTAVEGREFDFVSNTGTVVIPAGSTFTNFPLNINTGGFDADVPTVLRLTLTATADDGSVVSSIHDTLDVTFVGCQADLDEYTYDVAIVRSGNTALRPNEPIFKDDINVFRTRISGTFAPGQQGTDPDMAGISFTVICGAITIPDQGLFQNQFSNQLTDDGSGPVMPDGSFSLRFSVTGVAGAFVQTYTRQ